MIGLLLIVDEEGKGMVTVPWLVLVGDGCCVSQHWSLCSLCESLLKHVESTQNHNNLSADEVCGAGYPGAMPHRSSVCLHDDTANHNCCSRQLVIAACHCRLSLLAAEDVDGRSF